MDPRPFVERIVKHLPKTAPTTFTFKNWNFDKRPTDEGFGIMPIAGVDPEKVLDAVCDFDHYKGNIEHVAICRTVPDPRFKAPEQIRFYQKVDIPIIGSVQHELVMHRLGEIEGYQVAAWDILRAETDALNKRDGFRSDYNQGAWFAAPGVLGYALASCPKRDDVGFLKWAALTKGADAAATRVLRANIEGMARWAARR
jgi:hypothetical protein